MCGTAHSQGGRGSRDSSGGANSGASRDSGDGSSGGGEGRDSDSEAETKGRVYGTVKQSPRKKQQRRDFAGISYFEPQFEHFIQPETRPGGGKWVHGGDSMP